MGGGRSSAEEQRWNVDSSCPRLCALQEAQAPGTGLALLTFPAAGCLRPAQQSEPSATFSETSGRRMWWEARLSRVTVCRAPQGGQGRHWCPGGGLAPPGHGACKVVSCGVPLSPQTSNPLELTGRASAVHTLLQKAPGVGGSGVLACLLPGWASGQHGSTRLT